jgi:hypothetical protein
MPGRKIFRSATRNNRASRPGKEEAWYMTGKADPRKNPPDLEEVFAALDAAEISHDFMNDRDQSPPQERPELKKMFSEESEDDEDWYDLRQANPPAYHEFMESCDPKLRELLETDPDAYYRRVGELETPENYETLLRLHQQRMDIRRRRLSQP